MSDNNTKAYTFPFIPALFLIFITLKLTGHIAWSWFWVLSPIILPLSLVAAIFVVTGFVFLVTKLLNR